MDISSSIIIHVLDCFHIYCKLVIIKVQHTCSLPNYSKHTIFSEFIQTTLRLISSELCDYHHKEVCFWQSVQISLKSHTCITILSCMGLRNSRERKHLQDRSSPRAAARGRSCPVTPGSPFSQGSPKFYDTRYKACSYTSQYPQALITLSRMASSMQNQLDR